MPIARQITFANKTNAVTSAYGVNQKLTGDEVNDIRDKHNAVEQDLTSVEAQVTGINTNISNLQSEVDSNTDNVSNLQDDTTALQNQIGNFTLGKDVPANAVFTDTLPDANATNQGNTFNGASQLLKLDANAKVSPKRLYDTLSSYHITSLSINGITDVIHMNPDIVTNFVYLGTGGAYFKFDAGVYLLDFQFDFEVNEFFTVQLLKNNAVIDTNKCSHRTTFAIDVTSATDTYTLKVNATSSVVINNVSVKIIKS